MMLWLLVSAPLLIGCYLWLGGRRHAVALRFASLTTVGETHKSPGTVARLARHAPAILLLLGLTALIFAIARPQAVVMLPSRVDTIILAMDVSGSMRATDIAPNRLAAAQNAAKGFLADQPSQVRIGVVAIAATAAVVQSPTDKREDVIQAIDRFQLQQGSALGSGLVIALATLLPDAGIDVEQMVFGRSARSSPRDPARKGEMDKMIPVPPGSNTSAAIVLLSDGESNMGAELEEAGKMAANYGVRVFTVGVGTTEGAILTVEGWSMRVRLNEEALKNIAMMTRGEYFRVGNAADLKKVYSQLSAKLALGKGRSTELTSLCVAIGAVFATLSALISLLRFNRLL
jgi:Ca-activated chloride channel homolog